MDPNASSLAYKFVAMLIMLTEVNRVADDLALDIARPVSVASISRTSTVSPPKLVRFGGSIITDTYFFGFTEGRLRYIRRIGESSQLKNGITAHTPNSLESRPLGTNEAYLRAKTWLARLDMDLSALEASHIPKIVERRPVQVKDSLTTLGEAAGNRLEAFIEITWGEIQVHPRRRYMVPAVTVSVSAVTGHLIQFRVEGDAKYWTRSLLQVHEIDKLLQISDQEFTQMSPEQRQGLFARHSHLRYPAALLHSDAKVLDGVIPIPKTAEPTRSRALGKSP